MFISLRFVAPSSKPCEIATWDLAEPHWSVIQLLGWHVQDLAAAFAMLRPSLDSTSPRRHAPRSGHWCENLMGNAWKVHIWRLFPFPLLQSCGNKPKKHRWNKDETKMKTLTSGQNRQHYDETHEVGKHCGNCRKWTIVTIVTERPWSRRRSLTRAEISSKRWSIEFLASRHIVKKKCQQPFWHSIWHLFCRFT